MARRFQNAQQGPDGKFYAIDPESGDQIQVIPISRMDENGNMVQAFETAGSDQDTAAARQLIGFNQARDAANTPVNFTQALPSALSAFTVPLGAETVRPGDTVQASTVADLQNLGLSALSSPVETMGLQDYLTQTGMSLPQYQAATGAQPFVFNPDGTATYDPSAQRQSFGYTPTNWDSYWQIPLAAIGAMVGANALGLGQGAASAASTAAPAVTPAATTGALETFLNTVPMTFGEAAVPSLLSTGTLASTPVGALSGLSSVLPAGGFEALMAGTGLAMASPLTGLPMAIDAAGNTLMQQIGGLAPELSTMTPASAIPGTGSFTQTIDLPAQTNAFEAPVDVASPANTLESLTTPLNQNGVNFTDIVNGGVPSMNETIGAVTSGAGITTPTVAQTGASLGLPAGGLEAIMQNSPFSMLNPVSGLPTTMFPDGSSSVQQTGGAAPNLTTNTPTGGTPRAPIGASSLLSRLVGGNATTQDWTQLLGTIGQGALGYLGSRQQTDALSNLQNQMTQQRAPFLNTATGFLNNPDSFYTSQQATGAANAVLRQLSATHGNPAGSPTAQSLATGALYDRYLNTVNSLGSLGLSGQGIQSNLGQQIAQTSGQPFAIAGDVIGSMTSDNSMQQMLRRMMQQNQFSLA